MASLIARRSFSLTGSTAASCPRRRLMLATTHGGGAQLARWYECADAADTFHATVAGHGAASDPVIVHEVARNRRERESPAHHADTNADKPRRGGRSRRLSSSVKTQTVSALASAPRSQEVHTTWRLQFDNWGTRPTGRGATGMYLAWSRQIPAPQNTQEPTAGWARAVLAILVAHSRQFIEYPPATRAPSRRPGRLRKTRKYQSASSGWWLVAQTASCLLRLEHRTHWPSGKRASTRRGPPPAAQPLKATIPPPPLSLLDQPCWAM
jgi:hypothetical protein